LVANERLTVFMRILKDEVVHREIQPPGALNVVLPANNLNTMRSGVARSRRRIRNAKVTDRA
jgi:hypothetical protein